MPSNPANPRGANDRALAFFVLPPGPSVDADFCDSVLALASFSLPVPFRVLEYFSEFT